MVLRARRPSRLGRPGRPSCPAPACPSSRTRGPRSPGNTGTSVDVADGIKLDDGRTLLRLATWAVIVQETVSLHCLCCKLNQRKRLGEPVVVLHSPGGLVDDPQALTPARRGGGPSLHPPHPGDSHYEARARCSGSDQSTAVKRSGRARRTREGTMYIGGKCWLLRTRTDVRHSTLRFQRIDPLRRKVVSVQ